MNTKQRLERLERALMPPDWMKQETAVFTFRDGHKETLFWTDAMEPVLSGEIVDIDGGESSNIIALLRVMVEGGNDE